MKQIKKKGLNNQIGAYGEQIAAKHYINQGYLVISTNYLKPWGEIDLVARETTQNREIIRFVEVKTVSYETKSDLQQAVSHGTWRPEEHVHKQKLVRLYRTIDTWIHENNYAGDWQIDICAVRVVPREKFATVKLLENIIE
jgi:putative endonuclease